MSYKTKKLKDISIIKTGKIDSNAAIDDGEYPFFTCDPKTLRIINGHMIQRLFYLQGIMQMENIQQSIIKGVLTLIKELILLKP